jgi:hypothetical protein
MQQQQQQPPQQQPTQNNWPMHMGFNQNSNDGGFPPHPNNLPQPQQHKSTGKQNDFQIKALIANSNFISLPFRIRQ